MGCVLGENKQVREKDVRQIRDIRVQYACRIFDIPAVEGTVWMDERTGAWRPRWINDPAHEAVSD